MCDIAMKWEVDYCKRLHFYTIFIDICFYVRCKIFVNSVRYGIAGARKALESKDCVNGVYWIERIQFRSKRISLPVNTRHRFDIHTTSITLKRRRTDVKTTSFAYRAFFVIHILT